MTRDQAIALLNEWTKSDALRKHARSVELVMRAYARARGADEELWGNAGLLHDADYEAFPDRHPNVTVERLRALGEHELAHAISAHYTRWNVPYETDLDRALIACDELTGFVTACSLVRPNGIADLEAKSVAKKLKDRSFAAKVEREEVHRGAELFGVDLAQHITFIIGVLREHKAELDLPG
ncbi:MAG: HD domain-containing protein [Planctomycetota bacterium]